MAPATGLPATAPTAAPAAAPIAPPVTARAPCVSPHETTASARIAVKTREEMREMVCSENRLPCQRRPGRSVAPTGPRRERSGRRCAHSRVREVIPPRRPLLHATIASKALGLAPDSFSQILRDPRPDRHKGREGNVGQCGPHARAGELSEQDRLDLNWQCTPAAWGTTPLRSCYAMKVAAGRPS
jgi:hypothetical protein